MNVEADHKADAEAQVAEACRKLLANLIMERYEYTVNEIV